MGIHKKHLNKKGKWAEVKPLISRWIFPSECRYSIACNKSLRMHEIDISSRGGPAWSCTWKWWSNINYQQVVYNGAWHLTNDNGMGHNSTVRSIVLNTMWIKWERIYKTYKVSYRTTSHVFHYYPQFSLVKVRAVIVSNIWAPALWQNRYLLQQEIKPFRNLTYQPGKLIYDSLAYNIEHKVKAQPFGCLQCHPHCNGISWKEINNLIKFLVEEIQKKNRM